MLCMCFSVARVPCVGSVLLVVQNPAQHDLAEAVKYFRAREQVIRTHDMPPPKSYVSLFLHTIAGPDYCVLPKNSLHGHVQMYPFRAAG